ncbi:periplasmic binding protein-like I [Obelidium mucronatum]|nr:periplasmic binding protein-like I [Obelidium mucronatum]
MGMMSNLTEVDLNGLSGHLYWNDIAMVAAVEMANNMSILGASSSIAIKRFTDCKLSSPDEQYTGNSGGFASSIVAQDIAENHHDVIGAVGYEFSTTASGLAEALSFHKIPYCSSVSGSPRFRNKANYSYMFRTISTDYGEHLYQLYRAWNIRQVAIIYQSDDDLGFQTFISIDSALRDRGIVVVSKVGLRTDFSPADAQYAALLIMRTTARYFIISGTQEFVSEIIYRMGKLDLVKAGRVWMSYNTPLPRIDEYDQEY